MKKRKKVLSPAWCDMPAWEAARGMRRRNPGRAGFPFADGEANNGFMRGFIAAGLVTAASAKRVGRKEIMKSALRNGTAMAAGIAGANAIDRRDYGSALLAIAAGAAGLGMIDYLLPDSPSSTERDSHE